MSKTKTKLFKDSLAEGILWEFEVNFKLDEYSLWLADHEQGYIHVFVDENLTVHLSYDPNEHYHMEGLVKILRVGTGNYTCDCVWCGASDEDKAERKRNGYSFADYFSDTDGAESIKDRILETFEDYYLFKDLNWKILESYLEEEK